jgi:hypothetical protein
MPGGGRLALHADRFVHHDGDASETVPLVHLASVRVAFERDERKLHWAIGLLVVALLVALSAGPLQSAVAGTLARVGDAARRESFDAFLATAFTALGALASLLPALAAALAAGAAALLAYFWIGATSLTLAFAATERAFVVRGRNGLLVSFAEAVAEQLPGARK